MVSEEKYDKGLADLTTETGTGEEAWSERGKAKVARLT